MTSGQPQCDIIIDPTYHRFPYFRTGEIHNNREKVPTFVYIIVNIPVPRPLNNNACGTRPAFLGFPQESGSGAYPQSGETYAARICFPGRLHCNKRGTQAPCRGMLFRPILQHCSNSIAQLVDCRNS